MVAAAIVPLVAAFGDRGLVAALVDLAAWLVFVVDLVVHVRLRRGYLRTGWGAFDLVVVLGTFPWYVIPGLGSAAAIGLLRLGRLVRILVIALRAPTIRALGRQLGGPALVVAAMVLVCAAVVKTAEGPERYPTYGDAVWWAIVTVTTVGYGDYFPVTTLGRIFAALLMLTGVALLGTVAASLASFLHDRKRGAPARDDTAADATDAVPADELRTLRSVIEELRSEVAELQTRRGDAG